MRRYSFTDTVMLVNGVEITGWAEGDDVIKVARRTDSATDKVGAAGEMMVSVSADKSGTVAFKLQQTSPSNRYLNSLLQLAENSSKTFIPVNVLFQDTYRQDIATGTVGYIQKPADMTRGQNGNNTEWTLVVERLDFLLGDVDADGGVFG